MSKHCVIMKRMKDSYESRSQTHLTRRIPVIMRVDGKSFSQYCKGLDKPFDKGLMEDMDSTAIHLCANIQGAKCAYVQSDEISILITDYDTLQTDAWFDYNVQKMCSVSAGYAAGKFNQLRLIRTLEQFKVAVEEYYISKLDELTSRTTLANFDSRVLNIPKEEVANYFLARQKDAVKNSIASVAQSLYSHKELENKNSNQQQELIFQKGVNWNDFSAGEKRGRFIVKNTYVDDKLVNCFGANIEEEAPEAVNSDDIWFDGEEYWKPTIFEDTETLLPYLDWWEYKPTKIRTKWEVAETPLTFTNNDFKKWLQ